MHHSKQIVILAGCVLLAGYGIFISNVDTGIYPNQLQPAERIWGNNVCKKVLHAEPAELTHFLPGCKDAERSSFPGTKERNFTESASAFPRTHTKRYY